MMKDFNTLSRDRMSARSFWLIPFLLFLLNLVLKGLCLTSSDISLDEPFSIYHSQFPPALIAEHLKLYNNPPLFELLLHYWIKMFGTGPLAVRSLPLIFACLSPVVLYFFGKRFFSFFHGMSGAILLSFSDLLVFYAHDCRTYSLLVLLSLCSVHLFFRLLYDEQPLQLLTQVLYVLTNAALIYAHYFGFIILLLQGMHLLIFHRKYVLRFLALTTAVLLLFLPQIFTMAERFRTSASGTWIDPPDGLNALYNMLWSFSNYPFVTVLAILLIVGALIKCVMSGSLRVDDPRKGFVLLWFAVPFFGMFVISYWVPVFISRYLVFVLPGYYLVLVWCVHYLFSGYFRTGVAILFAGSFIFSSTPDPPKKQPAAQIVAEVKRAQDAGEVCIVSPFDFMPTFAYHYDRRIFGSVEDGREYVSMKDLLEQEEIFCVNELNGLIEEQLVTATGVNYLAAGRKWGRADYKVRRDLARRFVLMDSVVLASDYTLFRYVKRAE